MCRHLVRLGPPVPLAEVIIDPEWSLMRQAWAPRDMRGGGTVNADGFGVGWYAEDGRPVRYRRSVPMWTDASFGSLARGVAAGALMGAVRSATVGMPVVETACAPFAEGPWLFSHNGVVAGWPETLAGPAAVLPPADLYTVDAPTDSALLWALVRHRLRRGADPAAVLRETVTAVAAVAPGSRLNLLLTDGRGVWATALGHSLSVWHGDGEIIVASEPHDASAGWRAVPDDRLVAAGPAACTVEALT